MACYLKNLSAALTAEKITAALFIVTSGGGMTTLETATRFPIRLVESGPSGGAGYGDPRKRPAQQVTRDYAAGLVSKPAVKRDYAVVLKRDGNVDKQATRQERKP